MADLKGRTAETELLLANLEEAFNTGAYVEKQVGNVVIVGELHAYNPALALDRTADWAHARAVAERATGCVVEKEAHPGDLWNTILGFDQSYHSLAEVYGKQKKNFHSLEPQTGYSIQDKQKAYEEADFPLDTKTVAALEVAMALRLVDSDLLLEFILANLNEQTGIDFSKADLMAIALLAKDIATNHRQDLESLDATLRERMMQDELTKVATKEDNMLVVVGAMHADGMEYVLKNPLYRTPLDRSKNMDLGKKLIKFSESDSTNWLKGFGLQMVDTPEVNEKAGDSSA